MGSLTRWGARWWREAAAAAVALVGCLAILPPRGHIETDRAPGFLAYAMLGGAAYNIGGDPLVTQYERRRAEWELRRLRERAADLTIADSLRTEARRARTLRGANGAISVVFDPDVVSAVDARRTLTAAEAELENYPRAEAAGAPVIVALGWQREEDFTHRQAAVRRFSTLDQPGCFVLVRLNVTVPSTPGLLDYCALHARFGVPGRRMRSAFESVTDFGWYGNARPASFDEARRRQRMGSRLPGIWPAAAENTGCVAGTDHLCGRALDDGLSGSRQSEVIGPGPRYDYYGPRVLQREFLAWLLERHPERFGQVWRSPGSLSQAVDAAYGDMPGLVRAFSAGYDVPPTRGAAVPPLYTAAAFGWTALAVALAIAMAWRRAVA